MCYSVGVERIELPPFPCKRKALPLCNTPIILLRPPSGIRTRPNCSTDNCATPIHHEGIRQARELPSASQVRQVGFEPTWNQLTFQHFIRVRVYCHILNSREAIIVRQVGLEPTFSLSTLLDPNQAASQLAHNRIKCFKSFLTGTPRKNRTHAKRVGISCASITPEAHNQCNTLAMDLSILIGPGLAISIPVKYLLRNSDSGKPLQQV